jgi:hypothetical protein
MPIEIQNLQESWESNEAEEFLPNPAMDRRTAHLRDNGDQPVIATGLQKE